MRGVIWFAVGVGATVLVVWKAKQMYRKVTPEAMQQRLVDQTQRARGTMSDFFTDIKIYAAEREAEIREAMGLAEEVDEPAARRAGAAGAGI